MSKHTPGPWVTAPGFRPRAGYFCSIDTLAAGTSNPQPRELIADVALLDRAADGSLESQANARLIAKAPEMAERLRAVRKYCPVFEQENIDALLAEIDG